MVLTVYDSRMPYHPDRAAARALDNGLHDGLFMILFLEIVEFHLDQFMQIEFLIDCCNQ